VDVFSTFLLQGERADERRSKQISTNMYLFMLEQPIFLTEFIMKNAVLSKELRTLVFVVHGLRGSKKKLADLERLAKECYPNSDVSIPILNHSRLFSRIRGPQLVQKVLGLIDAAYAKKPYDRVIIIGHSMGAVLARRAIVEARGLKQHWSDDEAKVEKTLCRVGDHPWASHVELFVMMASVSRGWSVQNTKSTWQRIQWSIGSVIGHLLPETLRPTLFDFRQGCPFIVQTRLRWLEYCSVFGEDRPRVVQFLGTEDDVAPPNDTIDFATSVDGKLFSQVELPYSTHKSLLNLYEKKRKSRKYNTQASTRRRIVEGVFQDDLDKYESQLVRRDFVDDLPSIPDVSVKNLVFVVHGIRDKGYWTKKIAARIKERASKGKEKFITRTPNYGYFPILPFLLPWYRRQKVEWLMDHYVEEKAAFPDADMHYMGHSNGTYLGARALIDYPMVSFKRMMFAGSVVRPDFPWGRFVRSGRVEKVFNIIATADCVVAVFPNGLRPFQNFFDLGGAGHVGFWDKSIPEALYQMDVRPNDIELREYVKGGHSAGNSEALWVDIANFFVTGQIIPGNSDSVNFRPRQPLYSRVLGVVAPLIVGALAVVIIGTGLASVLALAGSMHLISIPSWLPYSAVIKEWADLPVASMLAYFAAYFMFLRFMALRF
jgi:pimeloyl-ACP methyl ester carboxylesterase